MSKTRELPTALAKKAATELNEIPAKNVAYISALREWVQQQKQLKSRTTDQFLIAFLRAAKFSLEKAKQKLHNFYAYRAIMPELFHARNLSESKIVDMLRTGCFIFLPEPAAIDGPRVCIARPAFFNLAKHTIPEAFQFCMLIADILLHEDDNAVIAGYIAILDLSNIPKSMLLHFDANFVRNLTIVGNKGAPTRMKGFHFLNVPPIFEKFFGMVKSVISAKLRERFYIHGNNYENLYRFVPRHILPREYGGNSEIAVIQDYWLARIHSNRLYLEEEPNYGLIQQKQNAQSAAHKNQTYKMGAAFGVDGSFRKLDID